MANKEALKKEWADRATKAFKGKKVAYIRWSTRDEVEEMDWPSAGPVIFFEDGSYIFASSDDEGNDAGALFTSDEDVPTLPRISC